MDTNLSHYSIDPRATDDTPCKRTLWTIVLSCLLTISVSRTIHPNTSSRSETAPTLFVQKIGYITAMFIAPELVVCWALRQWVLATYYARKYKKNASGIDWEVAHGFFLIMGGFLHYDRDGNLQTLTGHHMERLFLNGEIEWPKITAQQIGDLSKADVLSKLVIIGQTCWFFLQLLVRLITGLDVLQLEISTLTFAVLNVIVCGLWWNKPFDMRSPIIVRGIHTPAINYYKAASGLAHSVDEHVSSNNTTTRRLNIENPNDNAQFAPDGLPALERVDTSKVPEDSIKPYMYLKRKLGYIWKSIAHSVGADGLREAVAIFLASFYGIFVAPFFTHYIEEGAAPSWGRIGVDPYNTDEARSQYPQRSWLFNFRTQIALVSFVGTISGGIHLIAWPFQFTTLTEQWLWRASCLALIVPSSMLQIGAVMSHFKTDIELTGWCEKVVKWGWIIFATLSVISYLTARATLTTLSLIAIRDIPSGALINIKWTSYIPHL